MNQDSIAYKLSWEIQAMNDRGDATPQARLALEICYGIACANSDPASFTNIIAHMTEQVSDPEMRKLLSYYSLKGMKR